MKHVILRIAGTNGSGKTTAMREFLSTYPTQTLLCGGVVAGYRLDLSDVGIAAPVLVVGRYETPSGGVDCIKTQAKIAERILEAHPLGHVLYEGAVISSCGPGGQVVRAVHPTGCDAYAFLDTPRDVCIERVKGRRLGVGNAKEFNPRNLISKFASVSRCYKNLQDGGYDVRVIDHRRIHSALLDIIREYENA